jgi:hypothetical protein
MAKVDSSATTSTQDDASDSTDSVHCTPTYTDEIAYSYYITTSDRLRIAQDGAT